MPKTILITGRNKERQDALQRELEGLYGSIDGHDRATAAGTAPWPRQAVW